VYSEAGESVRLRDDSLSCKADVSIPEVSDRQGGDNIPPPVVLVAGSNPFSDPAFMEHIVRAIAAGMIARASSTAPRSGGVVTIVQWVKGMREMGCMTYHGEEDAEVAEHWLRKVERVINHMQVPKELRVDCVTQLLVDTAYSWWETIRERRSGEVFRWRDFREEFEERYCNNQAFQAQNNGKFFIFYFFYFREPVPSHYQDTIHTSTTINLSFKSESYTNP